MLTICPVFCILKSDFFVLFCMKQFLATRANGCRFEMSTKKQIKTKILHTFVQFFSAILSVFHLFCFGTFGGKMIWLIILIYAETSKS